MSLIPRQSDPVRETAVAIDDLLDILVAQSSHALYTLTNHLVTADQRGILQEVISTFEHPTQALGLYEAVRQFVLAAGGEVPPSIATFEPQADGSVIVSPLQNSTSP